MLRLSIITVLILAFFGNCKKENTEMKVSYSISESSVDSPTFNITYTSDKSGGTTSGSSASNYWNSGTILLEKGQFISMTVECSAPLYDLIIDVYVDGNVWERRQLQNPGGSVTISGKP